LATYTNCEKKDISRSGKGNVTSAVFAEIPIVLKGSTILFNNTGGGITIVGRRIDIHDNATFENNCSPYDGGGLSLQDTSIVSTLYTKVIYSLAILYSGNLVDDF